MGQKKQVIYPPPDGGPTDPEYVTLEGSSVMSPFGEVITVDSIPVYAGYLNRHANVRMWETFLSGSGAISTNGEGDATLSTGVTANSYVTLRTEADAPYIPGQGIGYSWNARFVDSGVANSFIAAGPFHQESGFALWYNGASFGILHRYDRRVEIRSLQITAAAAGAETATVQLNNTNHSVSLTGGGTVQDDAREIAEYGSTTGYADATSSWEAWQLDDTVYFIRATHGPASGTYSYSSTGTSTGSYTQEQAGANGTENLITRAQWDDPLDGSGFSGYDIDFSYYNGFKLTGDWLGGWQFYIQRPDRPGLTQFHYIPWNGNDKTRPAVADPRYPITYAVASLGSTTNLRLSGASVGCTLYGIGSNTLENHLGQLEPFYTSASFTGTTTEAPVMAFMCAPVDAQLGVINRRRLLLDRIHVVNTGTKDVRVVVYIGDPTNLTGYNFQQQEAGFVSWIDEASTALVTSPALLPIHTISVNGGDSEVVEMDHRPIYRKQVVIVTAQTDSSTTTIQVDLDLHSDP